MHYWKFNIGDWGLEMGHLSPQEEGICLRLINHFMATEKPIPKNTAQTYRKLRITEHAVLADQLLEEHFMPDLDGNWVHKPSEKLMDEYHLKGEINRKNGKTGGRPSKKQQNNSISNPSGFEIKPTNNPDGFEIKPTGNPQITLTNNQELETNNQKTKNTNDVYFLEFFKIYPIRPGVTESDFDMAWKQALADGKHAQEMVAGAKRYSVYVIQSQMPSKYIYSPATFLGPEDKYLVDWKVALPLRTDAEITHAYKVECGGDPTQSRFGSYAEMKAFVLNYREKGELKQKPIGVNNG
ncbi:DUF1376 domain-containing protein [Polynucleobacter sp. MWH-UH25E]|uniref:DUF1376 domain-containing protein n=1 Tax=Polynucleobacter sp. MWH-UH25E TaxID=1855616 RepID=UPI001BFCEBF9|nr:DUF1376 domain-containing protein [Polynucleobacter sp. MWH-UH25E]QWD62179.1 DUF1376 domain-containing protein [Polynucleobacter sp. MWH-UH25E]